jgi:5'-nucleotidase
MGMKGVLHILHTNDLHSHFSEMAHISTGLRTMRQALQEQGQPVVTVDLGDHMDRMTLKTEATWGRANVEILNESGYDLVTIGNNEGLTFPREELNRLYENASFNVLCANLIDSATKKVPEFMEPYVIQTYGDVKVGWIGLTAPFSSFPFYKLLGFETRDPFEAAGAIVETIRPQVDVVVVLSHLGYNFDVELARSTRGIDVILGGHTHTYLPDGEMINQTLVCQTGKFGQHIGHVRVQYDKETREVESLKAACIPSADYEADRNIEELITKHRQRAEDIMSEVVVRLDRDLPVSWQEESPLANLLAVGLRAWTDADIGVVNSGALLFSLKKGPVTRKDMLALCPHPINPCKMKLTGAQLRIILEESLDEGNVNREIRGFGFRGKVLGRLSIAGADVYFNPKGERGKRIERILVHGEPIQDDKLYTVGTIDMFTFGIVFPAFKRGSEVKYYLPEFLRDVLQQELKKEHSLEECSKKHWHDI